MPGCDTKRYIIMKYSAIIVIKTSHSIWYIRCVANKTNLLLTDENCDFPDPESSIQPSKLLGMRFPMFNHNLFVQRSSTPSNNNLHVSVSKPLSNASKNAAKAEPGIITTLDLQVGAKSDLAPYVGLNSSTSSSPLTSMQQREGQKKKLNLWG